MSCENRVLGFKKKGKKMQNRYKIKSALKPWAIFRPKKTNPYKENGEGIIGYLFLDQWAFL